MSSAKRRREFLKQLHQAERRNLSVHNKTYREINRMLDEHTKDGYVEKKICGTELVYNEYKPFSVKD